MGYLSAKILELRLGGLEGLIVALVCGGGCCLMVAVALLVGVFFLMRRANADGGNGGEPEALPGASNPSDLATQMFEPEPGPDFGLTPGEPEPRPPLRSSGQTIIAFDDDEDDQQ